MKKLVVSIALLFISSTSALFAAQVDLIKGSSILHSRYGYNWQSFSFDIRVDNLTFDKKVSIHYRDSDGIWYDRPAVFAGSIDNSQELWQAGWERVTSSPYEKKEPLELEYVIKYEVDGTTYWDNNDGQNYRLFVGEGEQITTPVYADFSVASKPSVYNYNGQETKVPGSFRVSLFLQNLGYAKEVKIHYSYDNWATTYVGDAVFQAQRYLGYASIHYPNDYGTEYWAFTTRGDEAQDSSATQVDYAISYTVNGETYWDNNFGNNYQVPVQ
ncbi:carbohydrate-binding protein [Corallincola spongiicola]|uniref:CBM21 domain-containing protein n=1 Tax=Corallincola spongiicola TaxID=2520508 RepID=A0ABY1WQR5_9GAMM|nr:carbohydrate-binding protein [Corallincola spongiicola]TAA46938.1 hypothetical protein EXY25_06690 [Corallincola spongiicola]